jgi:hypothetical protein
MFIASFIIGIKLLGMAITIREENKQYIGNGWNGKLHIRSLLILKTLNKSDAMKTVIEKYIYYKRLSVAIMFIGIASLFTIVIIFNS